MSPRFITHIPAPVRMSDLHSLQTDKFKYFFGMVKTQYSPNDNNIKCYVLQIFSPSGAGFTNFSIFCDYEEKRLLCSMLPDPMPWCLPYEKIVDLPVNSIVGTAMVAEDVDKDILYYELIAYDTNAADYFRLSSITNPLLLVNKSLNYDLHPFIWLNLTARDTEIPFNNPSFTATTSIVIEIRDADDKPPFFQPCRLVGTKICLSNGYRSSVTRSEQATQPLQLLPGPLYAVDGDYGIGDPISYSIVSGDDNSIFNINIDSGNITMNKPVDTLETFLLQVMAYQTNDETKYSTTAVQIEVKEKNNFPPTFQNPNYYGTIPLNAGLRSFVLDSGDQTKQLQVFATDLDFPDEFNPAVTYRIENNQDFVILRDGYILTDRLFTSPGNIVFLVTATDSTTSESTTTTVTIEITPILIITTTTTTPSTQTTTRTPIGTDTTITTTPSSRTTAITTRGTGTTTTTTPSTRTTAITTRGTGTTKTTTPSTRTTAITTRGTGTTKTTTPSTRTTAITTKGTGTTTTTTPSTRTTASTTKGTGATTTTTPSTRTTAITTKGTGTTTTTTPSTRTTAITTKGTGTTTTTTPSTRTTAITTKGTGTTTTTTPSTRTTAITTKGTGTTTTTTPSTRTTASPTKGTGTTTTTTVSTRTTASTTKGTGTTITTTPSTRTTASTTKGTGTTTTTTSFTQTTTSSTTGTEITTGSTNTGTGSTTSTTPGTGSTTKYPEPGTDRVLDTYYTANDMAVLGATLGAVLVLCLVGLGFLIYKQYGKTIQRKLKKGPGSNSGGSEDRIDQLINDYDNLSIEMPSNLEAGMDGDITEAPSKGNLLSATAVSTVLLTTSAPPGSQLSEEADGESDSDDKKVKSILTKDLKEDGGYKSVWFREDAAPEVMVIEGAENGEANDDDTEEGEDDVDDDDNDEDDDEDELDPTFSITNNDSNDFSIL
ncbi:cadherin-related family member 5 isoform X2 [Hyla sarda]|uniref:cadherin-related family member 5 isoform X2 n=1 Tax=Hyla sarda TaxID=327740 RepID=UPI0024C22B03|nr:cadherin-related family member 5 isoform X2 [Hyla sarda]